MVFSFQGTSLPPIMSKTHLKVGVVTRLNLHKTTVMHPVTMVMNYWVCITDNSAGNFITQNISNIICSVGICLITFASWQYTLQEPSCCLDKLSPNCSEFHKVVIWTTANLHISPTVNVVLAITGLTVSSSTVARHWSMRREHLQTCMSADLVPHAFLLKISSF